MITKDDVDNFFNFNMPLLEPIAKGISYKQGRDIHESITISYAYEHCIKFLDKLNTKMDIQKMAIKFIKSNLQWDNSQLNLKEGKLKDYKTLDLYDNEEGVFHNLENMDKDSDDEYDLEYKIKQEMWYNEIKVILSLYREQEKERVKQIVFDVYFIKGITKGQAMADHFNDNKSKYVNKNWNKDSACEAIRILKKDVYNFYSQYNN